MIEEENSDNCTDSEFSTKKKSLIFKKFKSSHSISDKKENVSNNVNGNLINNAINLNVIFFSKLEGRNSKSEIPTNFSKNKKSYNEVKDILNVNHKISKSEIFNLQVDMKKILDQLEKKKKLEEENSKIKLTTKKKLILDKFFKCNQSLNLANSHHDFTCKLEEEKVNLNNNFNMKKFSLYTPKNCPKTIGDNLTFKKQSPAIINRENCYKDIEKEENIDNEVDKTRKNETNTNIFEISETNKDKIVDITVDNFEDCFVNMLTPNLIQKTSSKKDIIECSNNKISLNKKLVDLEMTINSKKSNNSRLKDNFQHHRKKSSFFNSEDLRVSKQENFNLGDEKSISKNFMNIFGNNNLNKSSNLIEFDNDKNYIFNNDNSIVKMCESRLEISQNNNNNQDIFPSNLTSMISFMNNNNNNNLITSNVNIQNSNNKHIVEANLFDFDLRDSPSLIKFAQDQTFHNYFSLDTKNISNNNCNNNLNKDKENPVNKKTKSVDLLSVSNQVNINILYSNNKKSDDKTRVYIYIKIRTQ